MRSILHDVPWRVERGVSVAIDMRLAELVYAGDAALGATALDWRAIVSKGNAALFEIIFQT